MMWALTCRLPHHSSALFGPFVSLFYYYQFMLELISVRVPFYICFKTYISSLNTVISFPYMTQGICVHNGVYIFQFPELSLGSLISLRVVQWDYTVMDGSVGQFPISRSRWVFVRGGVLQTGQSFYFSMFVLFLVLFYEQAIMSTQEVLQIHFFQL